MSLGRSLRLSIVLALLACGASCVNVTPPATAFASQPPGARVLVDGRDSGWVTPCLIALDEDAAHMVTFTLQGHAPREVRLVPSEHLAFVSWEHSVSSTRSSILFPVSQPAHDLLFPLRASEPLAPGRVFVRLRPESPSEAGE